MAHNAPSGSSLRFRPSTAQARLPATKDEDTGLVLFRSLYHESVARICGAYALQVVKALWYVGVDLEDRRIFEKEADRQRKSKEPSSSYFVVESRRIGAKVLTPQKVLEACVFDFFYSYSPGGFGVTTKKRKRRPEPMAEVAETWQAGSKEAKDGTFRLALAEVGSVKTAYDHFVRERQAQRQNGTASAPPMQSGMVPGPSNPQMAAMYAQQRMWAMSPFQGQIPPGYPGMPPAMNPTMNPRMNPAMNPAMVANMRVPSAPPMSTMPMHPTMMARMSNTPTPGPSRTPVLPQNYLQTRPPSVRPGSSSLGYPANAMRLPNIMPTMPPQNLAQFSMPTFPSPSPNPAMRQTKATQQRNRATPVPQMRVSVDSPFTMVPLVPNPPSRAALTATPTQDPEAGPSKRRRQGKGPSSRPPSRIPEHPLVPPVEAPPPSIPSSAKGKGKQKEQQPAAVTTSIEPEYELTDAQRNEIDMALAFAASFEEMIDVSDSWARRAREDCAACKEDKCTNFWHTVCRLPSEYEILNKEELVSLPVGWTPDLEKEFNELSEVYLLPPDLSTTTGISSPLDLSLPTLRAEMASLLSPIVVC